MAANPRETRNSAAARRGPRKLVRWLILVVAVAALAGGGFFGWRYWEHRKAAIAAEPPKPIYVVIKPFVVTMLDENQTARFVQVGVDLEVANAEAEQRVEQALPAIQDAIRLRILQSKLTEVTSPAGIERLRKVLIAQANATVDRLFDPPVAADAATAPAADHSSQAAAQATGAPKDAAAASAAAASDNAATAAPAAEAANAAAPAAGNQTVDAHETGTQATDTHAAEAHAADAQAADTRPKAATAVATPPPAPVVPPAAPPPVRNLYFTELVVE